VEGELMKILICGAGVTGLALANRLAQLDHEVVLLERAPGPRPQGYMIDFFGVGHDAMETMGLLPPLQDVAYQEQGKGRARRGLLLRGRAGS
jgi:2-polyprenyl-6-methoxyphenol hydroxylase-like FAD-dependent oxidoreductase